MPRIAFQGEIGAYGHQACLEAVPTHEPLPCPTFEDALLAVREGRAKLGMIGVENSTFGRVADVHQLLPDSGLHVVGEASHETLVVNENSTVQVEAEATHIPEFFEVSVEGAPAGTMIHAKDLNLPSGTTLLADEELLIVNVTEQISAEALEAELEEAEAEAGIEHDVSDAEIADAQVEAQAEDAAQESGEDKSSDSE